MRKSRFFARVWRINAILILLAGLGACAMLVGAGVMLAINVLRPRHAADVVRVSPDQTSRSESTLGNFERVEGTRVFRAPLHIEQEVSLSVGSKETVATQNYLFYDPVEDKSWWLRSGTLALVTQAHDLPPRAYGDRVPVTAVVYEIVERDTDGNGRLTEADGRTVFLSDPTGKRVTAVLPNVAAVHRVDIYVPDMLLVLYTAANQLHATTISIPSQEVIRTSVIQTRAATPAAAKR